MGEFPCRGQQFSGLWPPWATSAAEVAGEWAGSLGPRAQLCHKEPGEHLAPPVPPYPLCPRGGHRDFTATPATHCFLLARLLFGTLRLLFRKAV